MIKLLENKAKSISLENEPDIKLWCCEISSILKIVFHAKKYHKLTPDNVMVRNITVNKKDFLLPFLSESELIILNGFKSLKKQIEWLCGRFLLKNSLIPLLNNIDNLPDIAVAYEKEGAPFLPDFPGVKISLSHSGNYTAVAVCKKDNVDIGVDIEQVKDKPDKNFLKIAFTENEIANMENSVEDILKKWTIKEAFLKYVRKGFNESLHRVEVIKDSVFYNGKEVEVKIFSNSIDNNYILALVAGKAVSP